MNRFDDGELMNQTAQPPTGVRQSVQIARSNSYFAPAKLEAFVAAVEEGGLSAAARRLHISQPALSQTISALEDQLGVELFVRTSTGVQTTAAGRRLRDEALAVLARHDQLFRAMVAGEHRGGAIRLGVPSLLDFGVLRTLAKFAANRPSIRVEPTHHVSMNTQLDDLRAGRLDVSFLRERPASPEFDAMLVAREEVGVFLATDVADRLAGSQGIRLDALGGLQWISCPRASSPRWHDELAAVLRGHGVDIGSAPAENDFLTPSVMLTCVSTGRSFALVPEHCAQPLLDTLVWLPIADHSVVRRTWAVWLADSRSRDIAQLILAFEPTDIPEDPSD